MGIYLDVCVCVFPHVLKVDPIYQKDMTDMSLSMDEVGWMLSLQPLLPARSWMSILPLWQTCG